MKGEETMKKEAFYKEALPDSVGPLKGNVAPPPTLSGG
jgi:hypothetical protein